MQSARLRHRARNHQSAHAEETGEETQTIDHPLIPRGKADVVVTSDAVRHLCDTLRAAGTFAYDSEFIGEQSYLPKLCLIQVASAAHVTIIDPLAGLDLSPFWQLICDASVEKIVHAGQQDVEPVFRLVGTPPANIFDTQIAAGFIGLPYPLSLLRLVHELVGVRLGKGLTFTSWDQRPLSSQQLRYAADDVRYLPAARAELRRRLEAAGHAAWAAEECGHLCRGGQSRFDPQESFLKIRGAVGMEARNLAVLRELAIWRDAAARKADVPPRTFLRDEVMLSLAKSPATSAERLSRVRGLPRPVESEYGEQIVAATQKALSLPHDQCPQASQYEPTPREKFQCDALWAAAQHACFGKQIDPNLVASRQDITDLRRAVLAGAELIEHRLMQGWRKAAVGENLTQWVRVQA
jgi:ribonuclease D